MQRDEACANAAKKQHLLHRQQWKSLNTSQPPVKPSSPSSISKMSRMREGDHGFFFKFYRMTPQMFDTLLAFLVTDLTSQNFASEPLEPAERLAIALRAEWEEIAQVFCMRWQFPNCLGAVDGKHVAIVCPPNSGSVYFNYKGTFSVVLMAMVDRNCKSTLIDVGAEGHLSDGGTFENSQFGHALTQGDLDIPSTSLLPGCGTNALYAFVGDEAFQLRKDFLRPYPARQLDDEKRFFNYRLSRARRCEENAFGITTARWRIFLRTIPLRPENVGFVIKAACILHNFRTVHNPQSHKFADAEDSFGITGQ
ncbi:hypothetical protein HPB49_013942 [Dermacentor silvarum]|uniref:Uncharacterized protein n=1 Tax=Dermacentor silvarum TaxID=543639 RepID=A0ACB8E0U1_DERSI|nr:hypothetical protein HPB49_013942 [Dermacentor silvarum]